MYSLCNVGVTTVPANLREDPTYALAYKTAMDKINPREAG